MPSVFDIPERLPSREDFSTAGNTIYRGGARRVELHRETAHTTVIDVVIDHPIADRLALSHFFFFFFFGTDNL